MSEKAMPAEWRDLNSPRDRLRFAAHHGAYAPGYSLDRIDDDLIAIEQEARTPDAPSAELRWHMEAALERLLDLSDAVNGPDTLVRDVINLLHEGLVGHGKGLTGVGARCPLCGVPDDQSHRSPNSPNRPPSPPKRDPNDFSQKEWG
jgi:hypothetical protein